MERMAVEEIFEVEQMSMEFDVMVTNKRTGVNSRVGFTIPSEKLKGLSNDGKKTLIIDGAAKSLTDIFVKPELFERLMLNENASKM